MFISQHVPFPSYWICSSGAFEFEFEFFVKCTSSQMSKLVNKRYKTHSDNRTIRPRGANRWSHGLLHGWSCTKKLCNSQSLRVQCANTTTLAIRTESNMFRQWRRQTATGDWNLLALLTDCFTRVYNSLSQIVQIYSFHWRLYKHAQFSTG